MLAANFLANLIGVVLIELFLLRTKGSIPEEFLQHPVANFMNYVFNLAAFTFVLITTLIYDLRSSHDTQNDRLSEEIYNK
jgi:hypothetical protein